MEASERRTCWSEALEIVARVLLAVTSLFILLSDLSGLSDVLSGEELPFGVNDFGILYASETSFIVLSSMSAVLGAMTLIAAFALWHRRRFAWTVSLAFVTIAVVTVAF